MKFLADMGIARSTVRALCDAGHDAVHLREQGLQRLADLKLAQGAVVIVQDARYRIRRLPI
jgi:predicted nuclease of predicted toxin-antitoxin system